MDGEAWNIIIIIVHYIKELTSDPSDQITLYVILFIRIIKYNATFYVSNLFIYFFMHRILYFRCSSFIEGVAADRC